MKKLHYFMHKVKGHSGDVGNDTADELAKLSLDLDNSYDNRFTHGSNLFRFMPQYNHTPIEQNIRKFIHKALHFRNYSAWSRLKSNVDCFADKRFDYDWQTTWTTINYQTSQVFQMHFHQTQQPLVIHYQSPS